MIIDFRMVTPKSEWMSVDEAQKIINRVMGISEEVYERFGPGSPESLQIIVLKNHHNIYLAIFL